MFYSHFCPAAPMVLFTFLLRLCCAFIKNKWRVFGVVSAYPVRGHATPKADQNQLISTSFDEAIWGLQILEFKSSAEVLPDIGVC